MSLINRTQEIKAILPTACNTENSQVDVVVVKPCCQVGRPIIQEEQIDEQQAGLGEGLPEQLTTNDIEVFVKGFSYANFRKFRQIPLALADAEKCYVLASKLT